MNAPLLLFIIKARIAGELLNVYLKLNSAKKYIRIIY